MKRMLYQGNLLSKTLVIGIIILFIGMSIVSSTERTVDNNHSNYHPMESNIESKEILSRSDIAYGYISDSGSSGLPEGPCYFYLDDPGNIYSLAPTESTYFLNRGTWTSEEIWYGCEYATGSLWTINPNNGDMTNIGGGGLSCNGLSCYPASNKLYGVTNGAKITYLIEYDPETGEQEIICLISGPSYIKGIAFDGNGTLYVWDDYLWSMESCVATLVGPLGIYAEDGHFDYDTDILYLSTFFPTSQLYECDEETGNCILIGNFEGGAEITCLAIPYGNDDTIPPFTTHTIVPPEPDGENGWYVNDVNVTLLATDDMSGVKEIRYTINGGPEKVILGSSGIFALTDDGQDIVIDYWAVDNAGNVEPKNSFTINMDQTPPEVIIEYTATKTGWREWLVSFNITVIDNTSGCGGMDRIEIFLNDVLQDTIAGPGPIYTWVFKVSGGLSLAVGAGAWDKAGNYGYSEIKISLNRNRIRHSIHPISLRFFDRFPLLEVFLRAMNLLR